MLGYAIRTKKPPSWFRSAGYTPTRNQHPQIALQATFFAKNRPNKPFTFNAFRTHQKSAHLIEK
jgi:hypothetical protein